ncbi:FtsQ-type POTRA domain-containing protein [Bdellovibrio sp. SKB1291214]|uniref:cell division protein FtsQ/DivIB n=1 Tax=Bdellovibrio sp. SKB1291214 TaxID=1732569 RepID=UPI000B51E0CC|nr:FtsQ-type POTRA domain-containing protein [Bdellovibrio sp. SKB1291214]UYL09955.1 FtsQ-type POTRA domain-containing protein [Bdellovibrio sp. SKB1291214]
MKKLVLKLFVGFVVIPAALIGTLYYLNENGFFNIQKVEVVLENPPQGQEQFLKPNVDALEAALAKYKGESLWNIKLRSVNKELQKQEWIEGVQISRQWPTTLSLRVRPYEVKLLYMGKAGKLVPIIKSGDFLDPIEAKEAPDLAILDGDAFAKKKDLRKKAVDVIEQIPTNGSFSRKTISEVRYDNKEGFWMTLIKTGTQVKIGEDQVALKAARVSRVVDYLETKQFDARVIDADLSKKVLVRLRKDP